MLSDVATIVEKTRQGLKRRREKALEEFSEMVSEKVEEAADEGATHVNVETDGCISRNDLLVQVALWCTQGYKCRAVTRLGDVISISWDHQME